MELALLEEDHSITRLRAVQDAIEMQDLAARQSFDTGIETPPYKLMELIGKGSFGRVYKATATKTNKLVAVKIMSIEEGDSLSPGQNDTFSEILKEVNTLRILNDGGAKNVNTIIDSLLVGHSMWMITEYCAGGSVATLMRPAGFLPEMWIIPILREVAEAIFWVHKQGIIHRDLKCANVLVKEQGGVQLCDFGVAGIIRSKFEKRTTITGTLQWMAPELFDSNVTYGNEVDIWAFGSLAYEAATGFPPNATTLLDMDLTRFGAYLRESCPRLEGDEYSDQLKDLIAFCMVPDPAKRPRIEDVQNHPYIRDSVTNFPSSSLSDLVRSYKRWEKRGGNRQSLFMPGGAEGHARKRSESVEDGGWDYGTMNEADQLAFEHDPAGNPKSGVRPALTRQQRHRRRPPHETNAVKPPLEKAFDPNTMANYQDLAKAFYQRPSPTDTESQPLPSSTQPSLPAATTEDTSNEMTIRESPIRNGAPLGETEPEVPQTPGTDLNTIKPKNHSISSDPGQLQLQFGTSRTQDWTFPSMSPAPTPQSNHHRKKSSTWSFTHPSRSRSSSTSFSIDLGSPGSAVIGGLEMAISPMSQLDDPLLSRRGFRTDGFTISSRISLIDLDASLVSLSPPDITLTSYPITTGNNSNQTETESFPPFTPHHHHHYEADDDLSSSTSTLKSLTSPSPSYHHPSSQTFLLNPQSPTSPTHHPSPLLPSPPNENAPNPPHQTHTRHHRRADSGYYPSSSCSSSSTSRERARTNSSSASSCCATPLNGPHSCGGCPTIDETLALDETPPQYGYLAGGRPGLRREPSLYLDEEVCVGDGQGQAQRGMFLPRIILGSRTTSDESLEFGEGGGSGGNARPGLGSPTRSGSGSGVGMYIRGRNAGANGRRESITGNGNGNGQGKRYMPTMGPMLPHPPRAEVVLGLGSKEALRDELQRLLRSMRGHLQHAGDVMMGLPVVTTSQEVGMRVAVGRNRSASGVGVGGRGDGDVVKLQATSQVGVGGGGKEGKDT